MGKERRIVQEDVARAAGVTRATVSMALRNHPGIPEGTRKRIWDCARKLGYEPDPMLAALAAYRSGLRPSHFHGTLAWLAHAPTPGFDWRNILGHFENYRGAVARAQEFGYRLEVFEIDEEGGMTAERIASILRSRNVLGILVAPQPVTGTRLDFPWDHFSAVTFGYTLAAPQLHLAAHSHYSAMNDLMGRLIAMGHRRIGFAISSSSDDRASNIYHAVYDLQLKLAGLPRSIPHFQGSISFEAMQPWLRSHRLSAFVCGIVADTPAIYRQWERQPPPRVDMASIFLREASSPISGIREDSYAIGGIAVELLVAMIQRGERGVPKFPQRLLLEGEWNPGKTAHERKGAMVKH